MISCTDLSDVEMPDTDDDKDAEKEYAAWKIRELKRVKREQDERDKYAFLIIFLKY
jgi:hypothetical protein